MRTSPVRWGRIELHAASAPLRDHVTLGPQSLEVVVHEHPRDPVPRRELRGRHAPTSLDLLEELLLATAARPSLVPAREVDLPPARAASVDESGASKDVEMIP